MAILDGPENPTPTTEQKQTRVRNRVKRMSTDLLTRIKSQHQEIMQAVWNNPAGLTPQQVMDAFGSEAAELFQLSDQLLTMLGNVKPDDPYLEEAAAPYNYTINDDGTVTIGDKK
jgi:hypothetical protein